MSPAQALAFVRKHGVVLESAGGSIPSLAATIAGEPLRGSWWSHPKANKIFRLSRAIRDSTEVLVCRIAGGKVTYVHRDLWPALVVHAKRFPKRNLAAMKEVHTATGGHKLVVTPYPDWVPKQVLRAARALNEEDACSQLSLILDNRKNGQMK